MTSLATLLGMIPMALGLEAGSEQYAPLARASHRRRVRVCVTGLVAMRSALAANAGAAAQMPSLQLPAAQAPAGPAVSSGPRLTLADAERMAIAHNPNISVARLIALAQAQVTREVRSAELPTVQGALTAAGAHENSRITAGLLNNPSVYDRAAGGLTVSQLITDFGRTHNLVRSAQSNAEAQLENERATELDITLTVDQAFYQALTSQAVLKVAEATVNQRQATVDQVGALSQAKLRSDLDLSFANVQLSQAKLLLLDAENDAADAMASLNTVLGSERMSNIRSWMRLRRIPSLRPRMPKRCCKLRSPRVPILPRSTRATPLPASSARPSTICGCRPFRRWPRRAARRCARIRFNPRGTAPLAQTLVFPSSMDFCTTPAHRRQSCAPMLPGNK
jgi:hypothetical protein